MMKIDLKIRLFLLAAVGLLGCSEGENPVEEINRPLADGELCKVSLVLDDLPGYQAVKSRSLESGGDSILSTESVCTVKVPGSDTSLEVNMEISASADESATRTVYDNSGKIFGANSTFRMLVFAGAYGKKEVDLTKPTHNVVCQVNATGKGASVIEPVTSLKLPKGDYQFVCFPSDHKFDTWSVGTALTSAKENEKSVSQGDDFVCLVTDVISLSTISYQLDLGAFTRTGYQLTAAFMNDSGGELTSPADNLQLTITDDGTTDRVINGSAKVDILTKEVSSYGTFSITDAIKVSGSGATQLFTPFEKILFANGAASQKLSITYPALTLELATGSFMIPAGTYKSINAVAFKAGYKYSVSLRVGPPHDQPLVFIKVGGVKWAPGNLDYSPSKGFFIAPTPDEVPDSDPDPVRKVHGAQFRWFAPYPQNEQSSPGTGHPTNQSWTVTIPNWSGVAGDLGNYNYFKNYMPTPTFDASTMTVSTLGDPCTALPGGKWRMPTYNEIYLLRCYSASSTPSGSFAGNSRPYTEHFGASTEHNIHSYPTDASKRWHGIYFSQSELPNEHPAAPFVGSNASSQYDPGQHLFLPAAGFSNGASVKKNFSDCSYLCSTPFSGNTYYSWFLYASAGDMFFPSYQANYCNRSNGYSVRCVLAD